VKSTKELSAKDEKLASTILTHVARSWEPGHKSRIDHARLARFKDSSYGAGCSGNWVTACCLLVRTVS